MDSGYIDRILAKKPVASVKSLRSVGAESSLNAVPSQTAFTLTASVRKNSRLL